MKCGGGWASTFNYSCTTWMKGSIWAPLNFLKVTSDYQITYGCFSALGVTHWTWYSINTKAVSPSDSVMNEAKDALS